MNGGGGLKFIYGRFLTVSPIVWGSNLPNNLNSQSTAISYFVVSSSNSSSTNYLLFVVDLAMLRPML